MTNPSSIHQASYSAQQVYYLEQWENRTKMAHLLCVRACVCVYVCARACACVCVYQKDRGRQRERVRVIVSNNKDELPVSGSYTVGVCWIVTNEGSTHRNVSRCVPFERTLYLTTWSLRGCLSLESGSHRASLDMQLLSVFSNS